MRLGKWLNRTLLLPLVALFSLLLVLLFSQAGLRFSIWLVETQLEELTVGKTAGAWLTGVTLSEISYQHDALDVKLDTLTFRLQKRCLIQFRLCIPELTLDSLNVQSIATENHNSVASAQLSQATTPTDLSPPLQSSPSTSRQVPPILFPMPLRVEKLSMNQVSIVLPEQQLHWQQLSLGLVAWGNRLQLSQGRWQEVSLMLTPNDQTATKMSAFKALQLPTLRLPLSIYLDDFQLQQLKVVQGDTSQQLEALTLSAQLAPQQVRILDATATHAFGQLQLGANIALYENWPISAQFNLQLNAGPLAGQHARLKLDGNLSNLQLTLDTSGLFNTQLAAELALLTDDLPLKLAFASEQLQWPLTAPRYQLNNTTLDINGRLSELQVNLSSQLQGQNLPEATLQLVGTWQQWQQQANLSLLQLDTLDGALSASGKVQRDTALHWQLDVGLHNLQPGLHWPEYAGNLNGQLMHSGTFSPEGLLTLELPTISLTGNIRQLPLTLAGSVQLSGPPQAATLQQANWQVKTSGLTLSHGNNQLNLSGELNQVWLLDIDLNMPALAHSYHAMQGAIAGSVQLRGPALTPDIAINLQAQQLVFEDIQLSLAELNAQLSLADPIQSQFQFTATKGRWQQQDLQQLTLSLNGSELDHQLSLLVTADEWQADVLLVGALENRAVWQGQFSQFDLTTPIGHWQLTQPMQLSASIPEQKLTLQPHCWQQANASLCFNNETLLSASAAKLQLSLQKLQLSQLNRLLPYQSSLQGDLSAQLMLEWQRGLSPLIRLQAQGNQGAFTQQLDVPVTLNWHTLELKNSLEQDQLRSSLSMQLGNQGQLLAQALVTDLAQTAKPLRAEVHLNALDLDFLKPLLDENSQLAGTLSSQLSIDGTLDQPKLQGSINLDSLKVTGKLAPTDIEHADVRLTFQGEQARLTGKLKTPDGAIDLSGQADWQDLANWQAALQLTGDQLKLQIPQATLFVKPNLHIHAQPGISRITGIVEIPRADITIDSLPQNAIGLSADHILLNSTLEPVREDPVTLYALETDIRVQLGQQVKLAAFGLKTRLNGELFVQQQQFNPTVRGEVRLQEGTFRAYGQDLLIRQGKMTFSGPADQPFLNVEAIRNPANMEDDVIAGIRVNGPADEPIISIFSEPSKPQANALSYLIMGRDLDSESGNAANSVTTSLIGMSLASSGRLVGEIGEAFGLRELTLDTEGAGNNSQVTVSGYLTRDLQLKYGIGIFQPIGQFTLRYRLMRSLFLEAVSGMDNAVDLLYKFEFD